MHGKNQNRQNRAQNVACEVTSGVDATVVNENTAGGQHPVANDSAETAASAMSVMTVQLSMAENSDDAQSAQAVPLPAVTRTGDARIGTAETTPLSSVSEAAKKPIPNAVAPAVAREQIGKVTNCGRLNVRQQPKADATVVTALDVGSEVMVDTAGSTNTFYKIWTSAGIEGYCMKQYIELEA